MVTVPREHGLRFVIYMDDHEPAHGYGDGELKIDIADHPRLIWAVGMSRGTIRQAMRIVHTEHAALLRRWSEIHG